MAVLDGDLGSNGLTVDPCSWPSTVPALDRVRQAYGGVAERYIGLFGDGAGMEVADLDLITRHLSIRPGPVLDVGCGPGQVTALLRSLGVVAVGVDAVPAFVAHARAVDPEGRYVLGSMGRLPVPDGAAGGLLVWYSLIHLRPDELDGVLVELRRVVAPDGLLVVGFFDGEAVEAFDHQVVTAYYWPVDDLSERLRRVGFAEVERQQRPGVAEPGRRAHAAIVARAV